MATASHFRFFLVNPQEAQEKEHFRFFLVNPHGAQEEEPTKSEELRAGAARLIKESKRLRDVTKKIERESEEIAKPKGKKPDSEE